MRTSIHDPIPGSEPLNLALEDFAVTLANTDAAAVAAAVEETRRAVRNVIREKASRWAPAERPQADLLEARAMDAILARAHWLVTVREAAA